MPPVSMARTVLPNWLVTIAGIKGTRGASNEAVRLGAVRELLNRGFGKATQLIAGDEQAAPVFDFRWANATSDTAENLPTAEHQVHHSITVGGVDDDQGEHEVMMCGIA
jgi:hypothetical protein